MADQSQTPEATPRPWFVVGLPWNDRPALVYSGSEDPHVGNMVADTESSLNPDADAALIVEAVNAYDRLRRIEAAARLRRNTRFVGDDPPAFAAGEEWVAVPAADFDALRAALEEKP